MNLSEEQYPEKVQRRIALSKLFYPLERKHQRRWGKIFDSGSETIYEAFQEVAEAKNYRQEKLDANKILWRDSKDDSAECMFCLIDDVTDIDAICDVYDMIKQYNPFLTYTIVHQVKDGEGQFDIFRFSKFSYLEHCNRVRSPLRRK